MFQGTISHLPRENEENHESFLRQPIAEMKFKVNIRLLSLINQEYSGQRTCFLSTNLIFYLIHLFFFILFLKKESVGEDV
jgi:hypothetical protein